MPIRSAIWKVSPQPQPLVESSLANEKLLEDMIVLDMRILSSEWILIGRQEITSHGGRVDLLAIGGTKGSDPFVLFHAGKQLVEAADGRLQQNCP